MRAGFEFLAKIYNWQDQEEKLQKKYNNNITKANHELIERCYSVYDYSL